MMCLAGRLVLRSALGGPLAMLGSRSFARPFGRATEPRLAGRRGSRPFGWRSFPLEIAAPAGCHRMVFTA